MPEPIEYLVLASLQAALQQIRAGDGFHYDVRGTAVKLDPDQDVEALVAPDGPRPFIVLEVGEGSWQYFPANEVRRVLPVTVYWVHDSDPARDSDRMQLYFRGCADVERAIQLDTGRGGHAIDTRITRCAFDDAVNGTQVWAMVEVAIALRRTYGEPDA